MDDIIARMTHGIEVRSKFNPPPTELSTIRNLLKVDKELRGCFEQREDFLRLVQEGYPELLEAASFVYDEYEQLGKGNFLVSNRTGRVIARITEDDVYHPAPMVRGGDEGDGPQRLVHKNTVHLKPEIESFFTWTVFEEERELDYLSYVKSSGVLASDMDVSFYTKAGRQALLHRVETSFWTEPAPFLKKFLDFYPLGASSGESFQAKLEVTRPLHDMKSYSVRANHLVSLKAALSYRLLDQLAMWFEQRIEPGQREDNSFGFGRAWGDVAVDGPSQNVYVTPGSMGVQDFRVKGMEINGTWYIQAKVDLIIKPGAVRGGQLC